jgi:ABC-2 type transport system permease protein
MKMLDIAFKDLMRSARSASFLAFGFVVPLLVSAIFYFAFGGLGSTDSGFNLPTTKVEVVNQDQAQAGFSAGQTLVDLLESPDLADLVQVTAAPDAASARAAVDRQEAGVAVIIPAGFTAAILATSGHAAIELYQDPTLTLGPGIVASLVRQVVDSFSGSKIAVEIALSQIGGQGALASASTAQNIAMQYADWATALGNTQQGANNALIAIRPLTSPEKQAADARAGIISLIMAGMMVFYVFFTGAASAQTLLQEEEAGTLPRLFTTPTLHSAILGGRIIASLVTLVLQIVVLLVVSALVFGIDWGQPLPLSLVTLGLILLAASFGLFITSLLKDTRQAGIVYGGVLTVLGMVGMIGIFTAGVPGASGEAMSAISLLTPQGWGVRGYQLLLAGGSVGDVLVPVAVTLGLAALFFVLGLLRFQKRFA